MSNNNKLSTHEQFLRSEFEKLKKNVEVIAELASTGQTQFSFSEFEEQGFDFNAACPLYEHSCYSAMRRFEDWVLLIDPFEKMVHINSYEKMVEEEQDDASEGDD